MLRQVELIESVDQSNDPGMHQVLEGHMARQPLVDAAGDVAYLGKLFHENALTFRIVLDPLISIGGMFGHAAGLLSLKHR
jgi:hypothetical protein